MNLFKKFGIGFLISFIGSIPLGYLNIIGLDVYNNSSIYDLILYLFGVVIIEGIVIYGTLQIVNKTSFHPQKKKVITLFSILFLCFLSYWYYPSTNKVEPIETEILYGLNELPFILGLILSLLNFAQVPYWVSWNLYVIHNELIAQRSSNLLYVLGSMLGTFLGMLTIILSANVLSKRFDFHYENYIWLLFLILSIHQFYSYKQKFK